MASRTSSRQWWYATEEEETHSQFHTRRESLVKAGRRVKLTTPSSKMYVTLSNRSSWISRDEELSRLPPSTTVVRQAAKTNDCEEPRTGSGPYGPPHSSVCVFGVKT